MAFCVELPNILTVGCGIALEERFYFFLSSRRRQTRWTGDWSSDVCSSDLNEHFGEISVDKYELVERYEALGDEDDFLAARRLFERELTGQSSALDRRQYGYLLECHGRRALRRAVDQYERAMSLDPDQDKVQYQWMHAKAALGEPEDAITRYRNRVAGSP